MPLPSISPPKHYSEIAKLSDELGFSQPSDLLTGSLLATLIATKPNGNFLELGTGTGLSLSWIVEGMDEGSRVTTVDNEEAFISVAKKFFRDDPRVRIIVANGTEWIRTHPSQQFDLIFADTWPGKYEMLEETLDLLKPNGFYVIDDMLPQPNWPEGHHEKATSLAQNLLSRNDLQITTFNWSTGVIVAAKKN